MKTSNMVMLGVGALLLAGVLKKKTSSVTDESKPTIKTATPTELLKSPKTQEELTRIERVYGVAFRNDLERAVMQARNAKEAFDMLKKSNTAQKDLSIAQAFESSQKIVVPVTMQMQAEAQREYLAKLAKTYAEQQKKTSITTNSEQISSLNELYKRIDDAVKYNHRFYQLRQLLDKAKQNAEYLRSRTDIKISRRNSRFNDEKYEIKKKARAIFSQIYDDIDEDSREKRISNQERNERKQETENISYSFYTELANMRL